MFVFIPGAISLYQGEFGIILATVFTVIYIGVNMVVDAEIQAGEGKRWNNSLVGLAIWLGFMRYGLTGLLLGPIVVNFPVIIVRHLYQERVQN
jgi:hypothetical protein